MLGVIAVLVSLVILQGQSGAAKVLDLECGKTRDGQSSQRVAPWTALLHVGEEVLCAGSLIHLRFVLTAAHCIRNGENLQVRLGEYGKVGELPEDFEVDKAFRNRRYNDRTLQNDIGLVRLSRPVQYKDHISPICIFVDSPQQSFLDSINVFTGTAWTRGKERYLSNELNFEYFERVADTDCEVIRRNFPAKSQFCAKNRNESSCDGPGGSALSQAAYNRIFQFGIASYNELDCETTRVYTDVVNLSWWIHGVVLLYGRPDDQPRPIPATRVV